MLLVLREIYSLYGIAPIIPGQDASMPQRPKVGPPPKAPPPQIGSQSVPVSFMGLPASSMPGPPSGPPSGFGTNNSTVRPQQGPPPQMFNPASVPSIPSAPLSGPHMGSANLPVTSNLPPLSGPPPFSVGQAPTGAPMGPPPMTGFIKKS